ncbi:glycerol-3-phosphate cytidylyltransferase [Lactiplantibacillus pentosus]|jgi:glycerol-3-phosphate cytidylyltransferase|uniref:Glycerol-3-phosphate cytidylyltransferase n=1 Tax=Lactiplantibacillus pentosus TaxID=1589 RepID=A0ABD7IK15_LACPE|nr:adenylyltransferase/cytidyltransferase family protein [Lactiplantibacillus pentosus]EIW14410.1 Glycerol-3-phosphate cytidylyltransferase [Lactiplantibacillus pentosus KCA1]MBQ0837633.1 adenylyltransferase/cytidyltransferase family protein [Lactiplantibacillus pentosus]MBU7494728.1 adenylyltransferase/cytidyltransferase family protein [Lactiplantibacillus pentosus]MBU7520764.1 adenylyltransferase/cytidyltransferase family protein [Lactiplantibacillus pentosus]MCT3302411.1 glycerol-3-phosphat
MKQFKRGYTQGVFDMFHVGHLNLINNAKKQCESLIVGVNADELVQSYKGKVPVITQENRREIVSNIKAVDEAVIAYTLDKTKQLEKYDFDAIFIGDDWKGDARWEQTVKDLAKRGVEVIFLPRTQGVSSTGMRVVKDDRVDERVE